MPPTVQLQQNTPHVFPHKGLIALGVLGVLLVLALGAWQWYFAKDNTQVSHADFYQEIAGKNPSFVSAEHFVAQGRYAEAVQQYETALAAAITVEEKIKIKVLLAGAMIQSGELAKAIPILKEILTLSSDPLTARGRATAAEGIAEIYSRGDRSVNQEIFTDEPFKSLLVPDNFGLTLRYLHEYAASIYPLAIAELRIANWYGAQLPKSGSVTNLTETDIAEYAATARQFIAVADYDIEYMQADGTLVADLRAAKLARANAIAHLNRYGDTSLGKADDAFKQAIDAYATVGAGEDGIARYYYALFLMQTYGAEKRADIQTILAPLSQSAYRDAPVAELLRNARHVAYNRRFPALIADIDSGFRNFLITIGWMEADFAS